MPLMSPGGAAAFQLEQFLQSREEMARQQQLDKIALAREDRLAKYDQLEFEKSKEALEEKRREFDDSQRDKKRGAHEKIVEGMMIGDIPSADVLKADDDFGLGNFPIDPKTGSRIYRGSRQQREAADKETKIRNITTQLGQAQQGTPEFMRLAGLYEGITGHPLPAGLLKPQQAVRLNFDPRKGSYANAATGQPATPAEIANPEAKIERLTEPDPAAAAARDAAAAARDTAAKDRESQHLDTLRKDAITELDKRAQPYEDDIRAASKLSSTLNEHTNIADSVVAEQLLRMTAGGQGSGLRLNNVLIDRILKGTRTKWADIEVALRKVQTDPKKSLIFTDEQRQAIQKLTDALEDKAMTVHKKIFDARRKINSAEDKKSIYDASTNALDAIDVPEVAPVVSHTVTEDDVKAAIAAVRGRKK